MGKQETIADILCEMRGDGWDSPSFDRFAYNAAHQYAREWADRIEAAAKLSEMPTGCSNAAGMRNCDRFKTWIEARNAFEKWCCALSWKIPNCKSCPHYSKTDGKQHHCFSRWLLAAVETEGGAE